MQKIFWAIWLCVVLCMGVACVWVWLLSYSTFLEQIIQLLHIADKREQITSQILTPARFSLLRYAILGVFAVGLSSLWIAHWVITQASLFVGEFFAKVQTCFIFCRQDSYFWLILALGSLPIVWRVFVYGYWLDEIFTYVFLVKKGLLVSLAYYPGPNNHVFFTAFGAVLGNLLLMRFMAFASVLLTACLLFVWVGKQQGRQVARWVVVLFLLQSPVQMYGYLARGYAWLMLFFLLAWVGFSAWQHTEKRFYLVLASISSIAGFYTLPTFVYAYSALCLACLLQTKQYKKLIISQLFVIVTVILIYTPIILLNGWQAVGGNAWLQVGKGVFWQHFLSGIYVADVASFWGFDLPVWGACLGTVLGIFLIFRVGKEMRIWVFCLCFLPVLWLLYQQVLPPARVWSYQAVTLAVLWGWVGKSIFWRVGKIGLALALLCQIAYFWQFFPALPAHEAQAQRIAGKKIRSLFSNDDTYQMYVRYEYACRNLPIDIQVVCPTKNPNFDIFILSKKAPKPTCFLPAHYRLAYENEEVQVFERK